MFTTKDLEAPLLSKEQQEKCLIVQPANHPSASVIEIFGNLRSKIYLIFHQIGLYITRHMLL